MEPLRVTRQKLDPQKVNEEASCVAQKIVGAVDPLAIFLFGSAGEGKATDQSDLDFLIVVKDEARQREAQRNLSRLMPLSATFAVDLIWVSESEFNRKKEIGGVCLIAWEDGKLLFASPQAKGVQGLLSRKCRTF